MLQNRARLWEGMVEEGGFKHPAHGESGKKRQVARAVWWRTYTVKYRDLPLFVPQGRCWAYCSENWIPSESSRATGYFAPRCLIQALIRCSGRSLEETHLMHPLGSSSPRTGSSTRFTI